MSDRRTPPLPEREPQRLQGRRISSQSYTPDARTHKESSTSEPDGGTRRRVVSSPTREGTPTPPPALQSPAQPGPAAVPGGRRRVSGSANPPATSRSPQPERSPRNTDARSTPSADLASTHTNSGAKQQSMGKSSLLMASGTAVSRVLGLVRNVMLVAVLGATGAVADAFDIANKIPNILFAIIAGGALNAVIVPQVMRAYKSKNPQERLDKLLTLAAASLFGLTLILTIGASALVSLYTGDWSDAQKGLAVSFALWCIPQLFFYGLYTLLGQVLNARGQFGPYMWAPVFNNVVSIIGFGIFLLVYGPVATGQIQTLDDWSGPSIALIGISATLGVAAQALVLLVPLYRSGFRWHIRWGLHGIGLRSVGRVGMWTFLTLLLDQIGVLVFSKIATAAPLAASDGVTVIAGNASYTQALMIYLLPHSLVTVSVATALFTGMSAAAAKNDTETVARLVERGLRVIAVFTIFATAVFMVLSAPITKLLIPSLTAAEVDVVSPVVWSMALGLMPLGAMVLMKWVYFAFEDGKNVFYFQVPVTLILIVGSYIVTLTAPGEWWVVGIGLSMSLGNLVCVLLRINGMRRRLSTFDVSGVVRLHVQLIVAAALSAGAGWFVLNVWGFQAGDSIAWAFTVTAIVGVLMVCIYALALQIFRVQEYNALLDPILKKLSRRAG